MIEVTMFVRDRVEGNKGIGVTTLIYDKGKFGVGVSVLNSKDKFDKIVGKTIALNRAFESLKNRPFDQIKMISNEFQKELIKVMPNIPFKKERFFWENFDSIKDEIVFRMAKEYMKEAK